MLFEHELSSYLKIKSQLCQLPTRRQSNRKNRILTNESLYAGFLKSQTLPVHPWHLYLPINIFLQQLSRSLGLSGCHMRRKAKPHSIIMQYMRNTTYAYIEKIPL